jgi:predicted RNA-binding Zn-ribbon protein involved in translation (DUF1610 family)
MIQLQIRDPDNNWLTIAAIPDHPANHSRAFFCPSCGDIWARWTIARFTHCSLEFRNCANHGGGFYSSYLIHHSLVSLPRELLNREFLLASENPLAFLHAFPQ